MRFRTISWAACAALAAAAFLYGALDDPLPRTNADRAHGLAQDFACPVCAGQSVAESDVPVAREIRRQIAAWVDEGRTDGYIRDQLTAAYDDIDYNPAATGFDSLVWVLPVVAAAGIAAVPVVMLRRSASGSRPARDRLPKQTEQSEQAEAPGSEAGLRRRLHRRTFGRRWRAAVGWTIAVGLVAGAAGVLVARTSGSRGADSSITGGIRSSTRQLIFEAQSALAAGDMAGAVDLYDQALDLRPSNAEALTYRGWLTSRSGDHAAAAEYLEDAIATDPDYPDARLFRAIVALDSGDAARAASELAVFDSLDPPAFAESLIAEARLRERIAAAVNATAAAKALAVFDADSDTAFEDSALTVAEALAAAEGLAAEGRLLDGVRLLDWVLADRPDDPAALAGRGWLIARTGDPVLLERGIEFLDAALTVEEAHPEALVYRAFALHQRGDPARDDVTAARADLAAFDALPDRPAGLVTLIEAYGLRTALNPEQNSASPE